MRQLKIPAVFMRGGTSRAIVFHQDDLPKDRAAWDEIFLAALGSPDPYQRQLNGMGGGISSLSKVCIVAKSDREDADIDYTFAQVSPREAWVSYAAMCGNMSSAMGPFAVDEGLVPVEGNSAVVRIHNTNTGKIIHAHFAVDEGMAAIDGDYELLASPERARRCGWISLRRAAPTRASCCRPATSSTCWTCRAWARSRRRWSTRATRSP